MFVAGNVTGFVLLVYPYYLLASSSFFFVLFVFFPLIPILLFSGCFPRSFFFLVHILWRRKDVCFLQLSIPVYRLWTVSCFAFLYSDCNRLLPRWVHNILIWC